MLFDSEGGSSCRSSSARRRRRWSVRFDRSKKGRRRSKEGVRGGRRRRGRGEGPREEGTRKRVFHHSFPEPVKPPPVLLSFGGCLALAPLNTTHGK